MKKTVVFLASFLFLYSCSENNPESTEEKSKSSGTQKLLNEELDSLYQKEKFPFYHGVASGDPLQNAVIIWTRVTSKSDEKVTVKWMISEDAGMKNISQQGEFETSSERDFTVKVDVQNLHPGKMYYYCFEAFGKKSVIGKTKTLPEETKKIRLGFASCSNYAWGYFNAYRLMGDDSLDAVIHLGDYIYEYGPGTYDGKIGNRSHRPKKEIIALQDYRTRYAQYRLDEDLQYVHAQHPFIVIWDDHELANNAYDEGAQNHNEGEGDWKERLAAAKKAYYEWMPIRENDGKHYRSFSFGNLADLIMLDTRTDGRTKQPEQIDVNVKDTSMHIFKKDQWDFVINNLLNNTEGKWKIIGNQILFSDIKVFFGKTPHLYNDGWSAYRKDHELLDDLMYKAMRVIIVTGDFHSSFAIRANNYHEFVVPSISSSNYDEDNGLDSAKIYEQWYEKGNPDIFYCNLIDHGYFSLEITQKKCVGKFIFVSSVKEKTTGFSIKEFILDNKNK